MGNLNRYQPPQRTFEELWRNNHQGGDSHFETVMFWQGLYFHALPLASILVRYNPQFFREDLEFLRDVKNAHSTEEVIGELNRFYGRNVREKSFLRRRLFIRISGSRVLRHWERLVGE